MINEIMYHPISGKDADQYVELYNLSGHAIDLAGWRFTSGIDFRFPGGARIPAHGFVVVARKITPTCVRNYAQLNAAEYVREFQRRPEKIRRARGAS